MALSNSQYSKIMRDYEERQLSSRLLHDSRMNEIIKKIPEYKRLEDKAVDLSMEYAKNTLFGNSSDPDGDLGKLKESIADIARQKELLLTQNGYPADYLKPVYTCPDCRDTGYIGNEKCHCFKQAIVDMLYSQSNIKDILKEENFENFRTDYYSGADVDPITKLSAYDLINKNLSAAKEFVKRFPASENLFFFGKAGLGKTFLSHCIADELLKKGHTVLYLSAPELFDILRREMISQKEEGKDYGELATYIMNCELLIIDDLGTETVTEFTVSNLNTCINERLLGKHSTIISTNLTPNEIRDAYGERNYSRIAGLYGFHRFYGKDIRFAKKL